MIIDKFDIEMWMSDHEGDYKYNLAETCVSSLTFKQFEELTGVNLLDDLSDLRHDYGPITGSDRLKDAILSLYRTGNYDCITTAQGCANANELVLITLLNKGDHVISVTPTYQQFYSFPASFGVEYSLVQLDKDFKCTVDDIVKEIKDNTKMIAIANPNNPTGTYFDEDFLNQLIAKIKDKDIYILCDEIYQGVADHEISISDIYDKGISTMSLSKVFSFAGLRLGWIKADPSIIKMINDRRDYHMISTGGLTDLLGAKVLENKDIILKRSRDIVNNNKSIVREWLKGEKHITCKIPEHGTVVLLEYDFDYDSRKLCVDLQKDTGVFFCPGDCFGIQHSLRFGFANSEDEIRNGLQEFSKWLRVHNF